MFYLPPGPRPAPAGLPYSTPRNHTPVGAAQVTSNQVYAFYEFATDLGSSRACRGNPTMYFRRAGGGSSLGAGLKLGAVRLEYATDRNEGKSTMFVRFGERF